MAGFASEYKRLNERQRQAVDLIDGPLLVIAGPGTGKTQLLSMRAGNILQKTDISASSILCLTFTEAAAEEMRRRMLKLIGPDAARIAVHTFHSFGNEVIHRNPEYFDYRQRGLEAIDDISRFALLERLLAALPYRHPFAGQDEEGNFTSIKAVEKAIKAIKQAGLDAGDLRQIAKQNKAAYPVIEDIINDIFGTRLAIKRLDEIEASIRPLIETADPGVGFVVPFKKMIGTQLLQAASEARELNRTGPLGDWRSSHTTKQADGRFCLKTRSRHEEFLSLIDLFEQYQKTLDNEGLYDYEDMVLWVVNALETKADLRLSLEEQYQYIMVDEYQDTNGAQNRLVDALSGVRHGIDQPNVMVVGDDDQAIMRFQGAEVSNMLDFVKTYSPSVITLTDNYRSDDSILNASRRIITQTDDRLEVSLESFNISKQLTAHSKPDKPLISRSAFAGRAHEFQWVADRIAGLISAGHVPEEIAVIAPRHEVLVSFIPYLQHYELPIAYERRENILDEPCINELLKAAELLQAINDHRLQDADHLLAEVLTFEFWGLSTLDRYHLAVKAETDKKRWLDTMLTSDDIALRCIAEWLVAAAGRVRVIPFEPMLDIIIGNQELAGTDLKLSPFKEHYFSGANRDDQSAKYMQLLSHLSVLRDTARDHFGRERFYLRDFLQLMELYRRSQTKILDTNPLSNSPHAVQVMTAHAAKGREFDSVFLLCTNDPIWGPGTRGGFGTIPLPENLPIYPSGNTESDRLRLLYVAMTRAKRQLLLTTHLHDHKAKPLADLRFLNFDGDGWWAPQEIEVPDAKTLEAIAETEWRARYQLPRATMKELLAGKLHSYSLSPTHLKNFLDLRYGGPEHFITTNLLRFPEAKRFSSSFGSSVHRAIEQLHNELRTNNVLPSAGKFVGYFKQALKQEHLSRDDEVKALLHAEKVLPEFYKQSKATFQADDIIENRFTVRGWGSGNICLGGKLDKIVLVDDDKLHVVDYKTGKAPDGGGDWQERGLSASKKASLHFNRQQLLFYKLLLDSSPQYHGKRVVASAELCFVEPQADSGRIVRLSLDEFDPDELERLTRLIAAVWRRITELDLPDTSAYSPDYKGILAFEDDLIARG